MIKQETLEYALRLAINNSREIYVVVSGRKYEFLNDEELCYDENICKPIAITIYPDSTYDFPNRSHGIIETDRHGNLILKQIN